MRGSARGVPMTENAVRGVTSWARGTYAAAALQARPVIYVYIAQLSLPVGGMFPPPMARTGIPNLSGSAERARNGCDAHS